MSPALSTRETDMSWIQHQYTIRLIADSRVVQSPREAAEAHRACWNQVLVCPDARDVLARLLVDAMLRLRDQQLAQIAAEHYQCQLCEIDEHLRQASTFQAM